MLKGIAIAAIGMISLASCKKDYVCECKTGENPTIVTSSDIKNRTLVDAKKACENGSGTSMGITKTCKLK
ncbi:MAG: hypothetical protein PHQ74_04445 [Crocinitomicaceae bacterium]|nr:hypothetical protein [Crocinitomicaceae bacterium]